MTRLCEADEGTCPALVCGLIFHQETQSLTSPHFVTGLTGSQTERNTAKHGGGRGLRH